MAYAVHTNHPETWTRREENFTSWRFWAKENAPWTGVGIDEMAEILRAVCTEPVPADLRALCETLDDGGDLDADAARTILKLSETVMEPETREVFAAGVQSGYGVRVVFSQALGSAVSASAYLEKFGSDSEH
ncbi:hypothetical protein [Longimicrobium sp.]|jgi:hypothetical protein|uniref:hypothetical protein n=1 Tax=Longimicrobium sp. TaxID=2029185 RepID=UPI002EDB4707